MKSGIWGVLAGLALAGPAIGQENECSLVVQDSVVRFTSPLFFDDPAELGMIATRISARPASAGCRITFQDQSRSLPLIFATRFLDNVMSELDVRALDTGLPDNCEAAIRTGSNCMVIGSLDATGPSSAAQPSVTITSTVTAVLIVQGNGIPGGVRQP